MIWLFVCFTCTFIIFISYHFEQLQSTLLKINIYSINYAVYYYVNYMHSN